MNFLRFTLICVFLIFSQNLIADECKNFEEKVLSIPYPADGLVTDGQQPRNDLGIFFHHNYDFDTNNLIFLRDENNYPIVKFSFSERNIKPLSSIIKIDDYDLAEKKDNEILKLLTQNEVTIQTSSDIYNVQAIDYDLYPFDLEYFAITAIDEIKTREGEFLLDYSFRVSHERPEWTEAGREIGSLSLCPVDELTTNSQIYSPVTNETDYLIQVGLDQDKTSSYAEQVYYSETDKTYTWNTIQGIARIKADFDLKKFPFDEQVLKMTLEPPYGIEFNDNNHYPKPFVTIFSPDKNVYLNLEKYKNENYLKEWTITKTSINNVIKVTKQISDFDRDTIKEYLEDVITLNIHVKRNINYFIFKIIIPVFLILAISWSIMWIPPNQVESRLTTSIVSLLALIAYNFVFNEDIPKLSYLTSLDRYILLSYLFCAIPTFLTIYFSRLTKKDYKIAIAVNKKSRLFGIIIYLISILIIFTT